jgi:serine/threonine protein kinase
MEHARGGDLHAYLRRLREKGVSLSEQEVLRIIKDVAEGLTYLHSNGIVHRDIKALNVLLDGAGRAKIGDLGVSKMVEDSAMYTRVGTPLYLAPELIKGGRYDYKVDIWALGCLMYQCACKEMPFQAKNLISLGYEIVHKPPKSIPNFSDRFNSILKKMLAKDQAMRPSAQDCLHLLREDRRVMSANPCLLKQENVTLVTAVEEKPETLVDPDPP